MQGKTGSASAIIKVTLISLMLIASLMASTFSSDALSAGVTTGKISAKSGVVLRASASNKGRKVENLKNKTKVTIIREVFKSKNSTKKSNRWYYVAAGNKKGYVRSDKISGISYGKSTVSTWAKVNYRKGAGNKMKKKGTFNKGTTLTAVLEAKAKDGSTWYKVRNGSGYVYVSAKYLKDGAATSTTAPSSVSVKNSAAASPALTTDPDAPLSITTSNVRLPDDRATNIPFSIYGTVSSNHIIENAEVGIAKEDGTWAAKAEKSVNNTVFNIASVDAQMPFGSVAAGSYHYKVNVEVDGDWYTPVDKEFDIRDAVMPERLTQTALSLAWPAGTSSSRFAYSGGAPTAAFTAALNAAYPNRSSWSAAPKKGASCDVFIGTTVRASGYDPGYPRGWDEQYTYLQKSDKWVRIAYNGDLSKLRSGDIILYKRNSGGCHTCMYVVVNGQDYLAEAQIEKRYGYLKSDVSKIQKFSDKQFIMVYRATN